MPIDLILPLSMTIAVLTWVLILVWYVQPVLRTRPFAEALRPLLVSHGYIFWHLLRESRRQRAVRAQTNPTGC